MLYNSLLELELINHSQAIAFADDLIVLIRGDTVVEAENYMNIEMKNRMEHTPQTDIHKPQKHHTHHTHHTHTHTYTHHTKTTHTTHTHTTQKKEIEIYVNNKIIKQENTMKYICIIFESKLTVRTALVQDT